MKTYSTKASDIKREWHVIDASNKVLGRLVTQIASLLMGKHNQYLAVIWTRVILLSLSMLTRFGLLVIRLSRSSIIDIQDILEDSEVSLLRG